MTWLKFTNDDYTEWCGEFRGEYKGHGVSEKHGFVYILTSDYLFQLSINDGKISHYMDRPEYINLAVSPEGYCIVASYYRIYVIETRECEERVIETPKPLDMISFIEWQGDNLIIHADEFMNWDNHLELELNCKTWECKLINYSKSKG